VSERIFCPYRGLTPYAEEDAPFFFGRAEDTQLIVANLFSARVTVLFGPSGVGKSSILRAGAIRDLRRRQTEAVQRGERPDLLIVYFRTWQGDAMAALRHTIQQEAEKLLGRPVNAPAGGTLAELLQHITNQLDADVMLMLDQFEEYFRYETYFGEPGSFAVQFAEAVGRAGLPVSFLLSLREDSLAELDRFKTLVPNLFTNWYRLDRLGMEAATLAVSGPVEEYNKLPEAERQFGGAIELEDGLAAEVLQQVRKGAVVIGDVGRGTARQDESGIETPYLQLVLTQLWEEELTSGSRKLRVETLRRLGGAAEIVRRHVETVLGKLTSRERQMCARMFDYLVTDSGAKIAYRAADLANKAGVDETLMKSLLGKLADGDKRILTTVAPAPDRPSEPQYEIYHDSLSRAVIAWRRRYVEGAQRRKGLLRLAGVAAVLVAGFLSFALYQRGEAASANAAALQARYLEAEARERQSAAEAHSLALRLAELDEARKAGSAEYERLKRQAEERIEAAARYEKESRDLKSQMVQQTAAPNVGAGRLAVETARADQAERDRDRAREEIEQLKREKEGLYSQLQASRQPATPASRVEQMLCRLERIRVIEDGSAGDTPWSFRIVIRTGLDTFTAKPLTLTLNDKARPLIVRGDAWPINVDPSNPIALIEISGRQGGGAKGARTWSTMGTLYAIDAPPAQVDGTGFADGGRARQVILMARDPKDGTIVFEFTLQRGTMKK